MLIGVAIRHRETGEVFAISKPARHHMVIRALVDAGKPEHAKGEQGFITESGIFLNREQAALHAFANEQCTYVGRTLCSENLW